MVKTNFTKVEQIFTEGLLKITVEKLLALADIAAGMGTSRKTHTAKERIEQLHKAHQRLHWMWSIRRDFNYIVKRDRKLYKGLNISSNDIDQLLSAPEQLEEGDWKYIEKLCQSLREYRRQVQKQQLGLSDEELIEVERIKHINKRFNISEKWLPLQ